MDVVRFLLSLTPEWAQQQQDQLVALTAVVGRLEKKINHVLELEGVILSDQEHLDADVASLVASLNAIVAEIAALKSQPAAPSLDFTGLDAAVANFGAVVPAPEPTPEPAPADVPPVDAPPADTSVSSV